jgi:RHS repeat-associated protein
MLMQGRSVNSPIYRYGFNGKENDDEGKGQGNQIDYGARVYDSRVGRFLSADPLTKKYPELTPYQFASNTPLEAIDLDGLEKYIIHERSFAPWSWFGSVAVPPHGYPSVPFKGDNRGFSLNTSNDITSRLYQNVMVDIGAGKIVGDVNAHSDKSVGPRNFVGPVQSDQAKNDVGSAQFKDMSNGNIVGGSLSTEMRGHNPLIAGLISPNIDWKSDLNFIYNKNNSTLAISGTFSGKGFPAFEGFVEDESGQKAFLGVFSPNNKNQILKLLNPGSNNIGIDVVGFSFSVDQKGNFTGVNVEMGKESKYISLDQWNSIFTNQKPAEDCNNDCGSPKK